jgi:hypothetical protein
MHRGEVAGSPRSVGNPARCPHGDADTVQLLSTVATGGRAPMPVAPAGGDG